MHLQRRDGGSSKTTSITAVVVVVISVSLVFITYIVLRQMRKRHANPKYVPTRYLKRKWTDWSVGKSKQGKETYSPQLQENESVPTLHPRSANRSSARMSALVLPNAARNDANVDVEMANAAITGAVNRHTSVRSVMTLPPYSQLARETEQILAREGERDGVDIVVEQPETLDDEEVRRESEMEALFQIREQRRREIAERDRRRTARNEARSRGDRAALQRLAHESAFRQSERETYGTTAMIREFRALSQERRVSSVSYADVGVARHDGTRIRADSSESSRPLLDSQPNQSENTLQTSHTRSRSSFGSSQRNHSRTSMLSAVDTVNDELDAPPYGHAGGDYEIVTLNQPHTRSRASSYVRSVVDSEMDLGVPNGEPPSYDRSGFQDAPPYDSIVSNAASQQTPASTSPSAAQPSSTRSSAEHSHAHADSGSPLLPQIDRLPSIRIAVTSPDEPASGAIPQHSRANDSAAAQA